MSMKFHQILILSFVFSMIVAFDRTNARFDDAKSYFDRRYDWLDELEEVLAETRREEKKEPVLNVTVIQRGIYLASVKINFLRNGLQDEFESDSIADGKNRVFLLQQNSSDVIDHVRVRLATVAPQKLIGDFQLVHPTADQLCFVLSGTIFKPVYSICAPGETYTR